MPSPTAPVAVDSSYMTIHLVMAVVAMVVAFGSVMAVALATATFGPVGFAIAFPAATLGNYVLSRFIVD